MNKCRFLLTHHASAYDELLSVRRGLGFLAWPATQYGRVRRAMMSIFVFGFLVLSAVVMKNRNARVKEAGSKGPEGLDRRSNQKKGENIVIS